MADPVTFHSALGASDFLGLRRGRSGDAEIVYDDGRERRMVWRVIGPMSDDLPLREAMQLAVSEVRVLPALFAALKHRAIAIEAIGV